MNVINIWRNFEDQKGAVNEMLRVFGGDMANKSGDYLTIHELRVKWYIKKIRFLSHSDYNEMRFRKKLI